MENLTHALRRCSWQDVPRWVKTLAAAAVLAVPQLSAARPSRVAVAAARGDELALPAVPDTLRTVGERAGYVLRHYWDALDFGDTARCRDVAFMEQNVVNYLSLFPHADSADIAVAVASLMERAAADSATFALVAAMAEKYLYEIDSPMYDEDYYLHFLDVLTLSPRVDTAGRARYAARRAAARLNRRGTVAADFAYIDAGGHRHTLGGTVAPMTLLLFYDPECDHCTTLLATLRDDAALGRLVAAGRVTVVAVFADGVREEWHPGALPAGWIDAIDATGVQERGLYVLRSLPGVYLLDDEKRVLLNTVAAVVARLHEMASP